jgi:tetratricopeptide (TPR) repeat protein
MYSEAAIRFKKVIELDSNYIGVYNNMGLVMLSLSRFLEAEKYFKKSIQLDSTNWIAYSNLGLSYHILQRWQEAADMTQKALGFMPNDGGLLAELAFAYSYLPSKKEVVDSIFQKSITLDANWPDSYIYLAQYTLRKASPISPIEEKVVNQYMEQAFARGVGKNGALSLKDLQTRKDFKILRNTDKWKQLMQKYFPDQHKK